MLKKTKPTVEGQVGPSPAVRARRPCFQPPRADGSLSCLRHTAAGGFANIRLKTDHNGPRVAARRRLMFSTLRMNKPLRTPAAIATSATAASDNAGEKKWNGVRRGEKIQSPFDHSTPQGLHRSQRVRPAPRRRAFMYRRGPGSRCPPPCSVVHLLHSP